LFEMLRLVLYPELKVPLWPRVVLGVGAGAPPPPPEVEPAPAAPTETVTKPLLLLNP
jgi:hypothetical protein